MHPSDLNINQLKLLTKTWLSQKQS